MDILMPGAQTRVPTMQRNAGGRQFKTPAELNAFLSAQNAAGGIDGVLLPLVDDSARFGDSFQSLDLRVSRSFGLGGKAALEAMVECFNVWNATNVLGVSNRNYSGYANVLVRDSEDSATFRWCTEMPYFEAMSTNIRPSQSSATDAIRSGGTPSFAQQNAAVTAFPPNDTA